MQANILFCSLKQLNHLSLCQPDRIIIHFHLQVGHPVGSLVDDYLVINVLHISITSIVSFYCMAKASPPPITSCISCTKQRYVLDV